MQDTSHRRFNPLTRSWVLCSPHRAKRPWLGQQESTTAAARLQYDPKCYLCPGNARAAAGFSNPPYDSVFTFTNDFAAMSSPEAVAADPSLAPSHDLLRSESVRGVCKVICFSPRHDLTVAEMDHAGIVKVVDEWVRVYKELSAVEYVNHVQIFENKGAIMGCSNPHPHGQVWATEEIPEEPLRELQSLVAHQKSKGTCLLCTYAKIEEEQGTRVICSNATFICVVPFWAVWPYETMILPRNHLRSILDLDNQQRSDLADIVRRITCRYDNLFQTSFPYSMGIHGAPVVHGAGDHQVDGLSASDMAEAAHLHLHFYPPLLRSATVKKFMVGYELMAEPQRDLTPEQAAEKLRALSETHYTVSQ